MPNAMHYLLVTRLKEEVGIVGDNYLLWASIFPRGLEVRDTRAKATNLGKRRFDQLLGDLAAEWRDDSGKQAFVAGAERVVKGARRGSRVPVEEVRPFVAVSNGAVDPAKEQLVQAVWESVTRTVLPGTDGEASLLGCCLAEHASDPWIVGTEDEVDDYRGLGFLLSEDFREGFDAVIRREFDWQEAALYARFWQEYRFLQERYLSGMCTSEQEEQIIASLFTMCVLACLVGPGSFVGCLGFSEMDMVQTVVRLRPLGATPKTSVRFQLQPVVFNGYDARTYYTSDEPAIVFGTQDVVRFGRDTQWMGEVSGEAVAFSDADVSRRHAELHHTAKGWEIVDVGDGSGSSNGTLVFRAFGGPIFRKRGFSASERAIKIQSGDIIYIAPPNGGDYDVELRRGRVLPEIGRTHRAFRFERRG